MQKVCSKCGVPQALGEFQRDPRYADGYQGHCRLCRNAVVRRSYARNREVIATRRRAARKADPEKFRAYARVWYAAHPEIAAASHRRWVAANRDHRRTYMGAYMRDRIAADPEFAARIRELAFRTRLRRADRLQEQWVEDVDPQVVWERDEGICGICGEAADRESWELDHVIPIVCGGEHSYSNTQVSHRSCNRRKGCTP